MTRPLVGITAYDATARWGVWDAAAVLLPADYLDAFVDAGAAPVVLPVGSDPDVLLGALSGLVLIGGPDVDPASYGAERHPETQPSRSARDAFELALVRGADRRRLPLFAICRGLQVLNVARGGTLVQHLPDRLGHEGHSPGPGIFGKTEVEAVPDSLLARALGSARTVVDCYHHQAIDRLGTGLVAAAHAADGTIEAVEDPSRPFLLGVQWHPEEGEDPSVFGAFVAAAAHEAELVATRAR